MNNLVPPKRPLYSNDGVSCDRSQKNPGFSRPSRAQSEGPPVKRLTCRILNPSNSGDETPDSTVTETSHGSDELVCFGMLCDLETQICKVKNHQHLALERTGTHDSNLACFILNILEERGDIQSRDKEVIAQLNKKTHMSLRKIAAKMGTEFKALVDAEKIVNKLTEAAKYANLRPGTIICPVDIIVSGPRRAADETAKELSKYRLFLQHPYPYTTNFAYENPQYLNIPGEALPTGVVLPPLSNVSIMGESTQSWREIDVTQSDDQPDPWAVLDELTVPNDLPRFKADGRIKTSLLRHQEEGVSFIMSRENRESFKVNSLWELDLGRPMTNQARYRHRITGVTRPCPEDFRGGLIADDMGLGKTLMMIASIVTTLEHANQYAGHGNVDLESGANATNSANPVRTTLVLVPSALLVDTWVQQIEEHVSPGTVNVYKYHGYNRRLDSSTSLPYDIVISTYATLASDYSRGGGMLSRFMWYRLVLDEAHIIRNWSTKQFNAVHSLATNIRWCMTGTPIQNTVDDLGSLIKFLRVPLLSDMYIFRKHISGVQRFGKSSQKPNFSNLRLLLSSIYLRRRQSILCLPGVSEVKKEVVFTEREALAHETLVDECKRSINEAVSQPKSKKSSQAILQGLLRMRMFCNIGFESGIGDSMPEISELDQFMSLLAQGGHFSCVSCNAEIIDVSESPRISHCYQLVCGECEPKLLNQHRKTHDASKGDSECPICDQNFDGDVFLSFKDTGPNINNQKAEPIPAKKPKTWPSKLLAVLDDLNQNMNTGKSIVFSFWRRSLDVFGDLLTENSIAFCRVDGLLKTSKRKSVLGKFCSDSTVQVLLMTLGTGAVGLNDLSIANRVHFLEPQWNPAIESQAIGRVLRLGQNKEVCIIRYIVKGSIEMSVEKRQITKIGLARAGDVRPEEVFSLEGLTILKEQLDELGKRAGV